MISLAKTKHIAKYYIKPTLLLNDNDKHNKALRDIPYGKIIFCPIKKLKNLDLLNFSTINYIHNFLNAFINFCLIKKRYIKLLKNRLSFISKKILEKSLFLNIMFINVLYILILVNNLYNVSYLSYFEQDINIKYIRIMIFFIIDNIIFYINKA